MAGWWRRITWAALVLAGVGGCSGSRVDTDLQGDVDLGDDASSGADGDTSATDDNGDAAGGDIGGDGGDGSSLFPWSPPRTLVDDLGRLAIASEVHVVGHLNGNLVHRRSADDGVTWSEPTIIATATGNFPAMYGGLFAMADSVYLVTAPQDMDASAASGGRQLDFRKSINGGATWTDPVRITDSGTPIFRCRIGASGDVVHVVGTTNPTGDASLIYFRSTNGGEDWSSTPLATGLGTYGGGQTVAIDGQVVHVAYTKVETGVGAGPTLYRRSGDNGATWSDPVPIGESSAESNRQARVQLTAADGRVFAVWQREATVSGSPVPADRIGYALSGDGGETWSDARVLPYDTSVDRNHQHVWLAPGGGVHVIWRHGDSGDALDDPAGFVSSMDYGATWGDRMFAVDTRGQIVGSNHPWSIVADDAAVHVLVGPSGAMQYARRPLR